MGKTIANSTIPCTCKTAQSYWDWKDKEISRHYEEQEKFSIEERQRRYTERIMKSSGLKAKFKNRTFKTFKKNETNQVAFYKAYLYTKTFAHNKGEGLFFTGNCGTGKTHLAAAIANQLLQMKKQVIFRTSIELLDDIKRTFEDKSSTFNLIDLFKTADLLVIDDLGKEVFKDWSLSQLNAIIDGRYERNLPVIITANYNDVELRRRLAMNAESKTASAIISRLYEMCELVEMNWDDCRRGGTL